jgi:hypothetical protein
MKISIKLLSIILLGLSIASCEEDFLDRKPSNMVSEEIITSNATTIEVGINGTYRTLASYMFDGLYVPALVEVTSGDALICQANNYSWFVPDYQHNIQSTSGYAGSIWIRAYRVIDNANVILANIDEAQGDESALANLKGEALTLRAYSYMKLANLFQAETYSANKQADCVPLRVQPYDAAEDPGLERATNEQIYLQIEQDLLEAVDLLNDNNRTGRFSKRAAQGLLARLYLEMEQWQDASDWAIACHRSQVLDPSLITDGFYDYNAESLFGYDYTETDNGIFASHPSFWYYMRPGYEGEIYGYSSIRYTPEFVDLFADDDARKMFVEDDLGFFGSDGSYFTYKFQHRNDQLSVARMIKMRVSEMYLIEAEAKARLLDEVGARNALFVVQQRSIPSASLSTNSGDDLINEIYAERKKELYGESFGVLDNKRMKIDVDRSSSFHWGYESSSITWNNPILVQPIPQSEIDANPLISQEDQNEAYR